MVYRVLECCLFFKTYIESGMRMKRKKEQDVWAKEQEVAFVLVCLITAGNKREKKKVKVG